MKRAAFMGFAAVFGCHPFTSTTTTTSSHRIATERAIRDVTDARCEREIACGVVAPERRDACTRDARATTHVGLACDNGVDAAKLALCVQQVRTTPCGPTDGVDLVAACRGQSLCR
jgi:hypothetical protein